MDAIQMPEPDGERWRLLRAGIQNVWEYDDQRFVFHRGRLLLRGRNESGKTKALEVLLPFLLDADLSPERLDPFGSTGRPMHWNLLNEGNEEVKVAIGYVWLELGRRSAAGPEFCTIGAGLRAKRDGTHKVDAWYFVTSRRVDVDLHPLDGDRVPLPRPRFEAAIGAAGQVFERAGGEYRRALNARLFQMPEEQFAILIEALLQLRRPQLSKQLDTAELSRILSASLPSLEARVIRPLAEGFERLDHHRNERENWQGTLDATRAFVDVYKDYLAAIAKARALELTRADSAYQSARAAARETKAAWEQALADRAALVDEIARLERDHEALVEWVRTLESSDEYRAVQELDDAENRAQQDWSTAEAAARRWRDEQAALEDARGRLQRIEAQVHAQSERAHAAAQTSAAYAIDAGLAIEHSEIAALIARGELDAARSVVESVTRARDEAAIRLARLNREVEHAADMAAQAETRRSDAEQRVRAAQEAFHAAESALDGASETYRAEVEAWADALQVVALDGATRDRLRHAELDDVRAVAERAVEQQRRQIDEQRSGARLARAEVEGQSTPLVAERADLLTRPHRPPPGPSWRTGRTDEQPGAPLYMLCDFVPDQNEPAELEAALEAAGLLDAWVMPDGVVVDARTRDAILVATPLEGRTLADVLVPTAAGGVDADVVGRVLATIGFVEATAAPPEVSCWVATDGRFRIGPIQGAASKTTPMFIGATAREQARRQRLTELDAAIAALDAQRESLTTQIERLQRAHAQIDEEIGCFAELRPVLEARARIAALGQQLGHERAALETARTAWLRAEEAARAIERARDAEAARLGLSGWIDALDQLRARTHQYRSATSDAIADSRELARLGAAADEQRMTRDAVELRVQRATLDREETATQAARAKARAAALREAIGATRDEFLRRLHEAKRGQTETRHSLNEKRQLQSPLDQHVGSTKTDAEDKENAVGARDEQRRAAERGLKDLARTGLLELSALTLDGAPDTWSFTEALLAARRIDSETGVLDCAPAALDRLENRVGAKHRELALPPELRILPLRSGGVFEYRATLNGRALGLVELLRELASDVEARDRLLDAQERDLFESFLSGETHEHLRTRLREANQLVQRITTQLEQRKTLSGMQVRLKWQVSDEAPTGTSAAIDLLMRSARLLVEADREALRRFLQQRLGEARARDSVGPLEARMLEVLDYRSWFRFAIEFRSAGQDWKPLTRKSHAAGSGGQKAVVMHLPLFAAAAAFYESAAPTAPRLIVLDEAFAGIDKTMRGQLMGLLAEFDLDFVMTSHEEWGFYAELDGLSTYHLARAENMRGVYCDWFLWDGHEARQIEIA